LVTAQDLPPPLWGSAGVGAVPRRTADREAGKHFFFEKKKQKTFDDSASVLQERPRPNSQSVLVLFSKKKVFHQIFSRVT
jgi:hypothetical protein